MDSRAVKRAAAADMAFFFEEGITHGGIGEHFCYLLSQAGFSGKFYLRGVNGFVPQQTMGEGLASLGLDDNGMVQMILAGCAENDKKKT